MNDQYLCPSCQKPLTATKNIGAVVTEGWLSKGTAFIYCARGKCKSEVAHDGASGETLDEAFTALEKKVAEEILERDDE